MILILIHVQEYREIHSIRMYECTVIQFENFVKFSELILNDVQNESKSRARRVERWRGWQMKREEKRREQECPQNILTTVP